MSLLLLLLLLPAGGSGRTFGLMLFVDRDGNERAVANPVFLWKATNTATISVARNKVLIIFSG